MRSSAASSSPGRSREEPPRRPRRQGSKDKDEKDETPLIMVASREGGREVERKLFTGQEDFLEKYENYVIMIDKGRSMPILGTAANLFGQFRGELVSPRR